MEDQQPPEFSRPFNTDKLTHNPRHEKIMANESERAALATRFGILDLSQLEADLTLQRLVDDTAVVVLEGTLRATVTQACVVTLEPVTETISESFETHFAPPAYVEQWLKEHPDDDLDAPEELERGYIDLGEIVAQYLALALNPYPRKAGLPDDENIITVIAGDEKPNPFAALAALKTTPKQDK